MADIDYEDIELRRKLRAAGYAIAELGVEITQLRSALAIAAGLISTMPEYETQHPQTIYEDLLSNGVKETSLGRS